MAQTDDLKQEKKSLMIAVKSLKDVQQQRSRLSNRLKEKKDGSKQTIPDGQEYYLAEADKEIFHAWKHALDEQEKSIQKYIAKKVKKFPIFTEFLQNVRGIDAKTAGRLIAELDPHKAPNPSSFFLYCGLAPGYVPAQKFVKYEQAKKMDNVEIISTFKSTDGEKAKVRCFDEFVRGDSMTKGYLVPYNKDLKSYVLGVIGESFIKQQNHYALKFYYPYKARLQSMSEHKDKQKIFFHNRGRRYMVKQFIKDLHLNWRELEGLPVPQPYEEKYLNQYHTDKPTDLPGQIREEIRG